jgi:hypothetical protein
MSWVGFLYIPGLGLYDHDPSFANDYLMFTLEFLLEPSIMDQAPNVNS